MGKKATATWTDPNPTTNVDHIEIWRKTGVGGTYAKISGNIALGVQTYEDTNGGSGLTDAQEYFYQIRAYNGTGQYSFVEGSVVISDSVLFEDDFAGSTIDTTVNWDLTNADTGRVTYSQNDELIINYLASGGAASYTEHLLSKSQFDIDSTLVLKFDLNTKASSNEGSWSIAFVKNNPTTNDDDRIGFSRGAVGTNEVKVSVKEGGTLQHSATHTITGLANTYHSFKVEITGGNAVFYHWNGSAWAQLSSFAESSTGNWYVAIATVANGFSSGQIKVDNLVVTNSSFTGQNP